MRTREVVHSVSIVHGEGTPTIGWGKVGFVDNPRPLNAQGWNLEFGVGGLSGQGLG